MGLDMYLYKKTYVKNWDETPSENRHEVTVTRGGKVVDESAVNPERVTYIVEDAGYWRKANAIHRWFVANVQEGVDNCGTYYVSREKLQHLLAVVERVLEASELVDGKIANGFTFKDGKETPILADGQYIKDPGVARALLPTTDGFFFGSTDYDQYYIEDLAETRRILAEALAGDESAEFEYTSSW
ncbi:MAG: hypothetical protein ACRDJW_25485 [Thermomicrobiales bacterium]